MRLIPRERIVIPDKRQRSKMDPIKLRELRESILSPKGLLQPPVVQKNAENGEYILVAGGRRLTVIDQIQANDGIFSCDGQVVTPGEVPVIFIDELLPADELFEAELDENLRREELPWPDVSRALSDLHKLRKSENPKQTMVETATEVATRAGAKSQPATFERLRKAVVIAEHLDNPKIAAARNSTEAYNLILKSEEEKLRSILTRRQQKLAPNTSPLLEVRHGDCLSILPKLEAGTTDLILTDPPYGIDASGGGFRSRTIHHHNYSDTVESARELALAILTEGFRICKPRANLFMFSDIKHWEWLQQVSAQVGWVPWRTPIIWQKSESEGLAPWGSHGFRRTYEVLFYATKGQRGLITSPVDILTYKRVSRHERIHAAEKPVELLRCLIDCSTLPNDNVLDPCCGSGSTLVAARESNRRALGIEKDLDFYNTAMANVFKTT